MKTQLGSRARWAIRSARVGVALAAALIAGTASAQSVPGGDSDDLLLPQLPASTAQPSAEAAPEAEPQPAEDTKPGKKKKKTKKPRKPAPPMTPQMEAEIREYDDRLATVASAKSAQFAGMSLLILSYVPSLLIGGLAAETKSKKLEPLGWLAVPAVGPFITMATMPVDDAGRSVLIADGVVQSIGLTTLLVGMLVEKSANRAMMRSSGAPGPNVAIQVAPVVTPTTGGLAISGSF